jgi:hypothetical protein
LSVVPQLLDCARFLLARLKEQDAP